MLAAARFAAVPIPTIPGTFSVPARRFLSCAPPWINERIFTPVRMYMIPIPFGPLNLCPLALNISMWHSSTLIGSCPKACTASVWNRMPCSWAISPISLIGWMVPISLFANITEIRIVVGRIAAFKSSSFTFPSSSTSRYVTSNPLFSRYSAVWRIAWCSIFVVMIWLPLFA